MAYKPKVLTPSEGGSGVTSFTAYTTLFGGTTSTGNLQNAASVGTSGQVLTSNGAGALPSFQDASGGGLGIIVSMNTANSGPADAQTYYLAPNQQIESSATNNANAKFIIPVDCTVTACYGAVTVGSGTLGSSENSTLYIRVNDTTDTTITSTLKMDATSVTFNNTGLSISLSAGDYISFKLTTPTWAPNPAFVVISLSVYAS